MNRTSLVIGAITLTLLGLSACAPRPGAAAYVGDDRITVDQVQADSTEVIAAAATAGQTGLDPAEVNRRQVNRLITERLLAVEAARQGIVVTDADVDALLRQAVGTTPRTTFADQLAASQLVPPSKLEEFARSVALNQRVSAALAPAGTETVRTAAIVKQLGALSVELGTGVSQRYGAWDPKDVTVTLPPEDLAEPAPVATATSGSVVNQ